MWDLPPTERRRSATPAAPALVPFVLAIGPAIVAIGLARREGRGALGRLRRSLTLRPKDRRWYLVLLLPVGWALAVVAAAVALGEPTSLSDSFRATDLIVPLVVLIPAASRLHGPRRMNPRPSCRHTKQRSDEAVGVARPPGPPGTRGRRSRHLSPPRSPPSATNARGIHRVLGHNPTCRQASEPC